jgi:hypothetical protein
VSSASSGKLPACLPTTARSSGSVASSRRDGASDSRQRQRDPASIAGRDVFGDLEAELLRVVVAAARTVIEQEGVDALSMRRVAEQLGSSPMALYRHVRDKDQLLVLLLDALAVSCA